MKQSVSLGVSVVLSVFLFGFAYSQDGRIKLTVSEECALRLTQQPVASKLKLTSAQRNSIKAAQVGYEARVNKLTAKLDPTGAKLDGATKSYADTCLNALTPGQQNDLLSLGVPEIGIRALQDSVVSAKLNLTAVQETKIRSIVKSWDKEDEDYSAMIAKALMAIPEPAPGADRSQYDKKCADTLRTYEGERQRIARDKEDAEHKVLALMSKTQQLRWAAMSGISGNAPKN